MDPIKTFLIADDDSEVREAIAEAIKHYYKDCRVYTAGDGSEAMQKVRNAPPNLVILDFNMPKVTGIEMIEQMQKINSFARIPIIVMSGREHDVDELQQIRAKGMMFAEKPFKTQYLMGLIDGVFNGNKIRQVQIESRPVKAGEMVFEEGDASGSLYLVKSGSLRVFKTTDGKVREIATIGPHELVGEMAFVDKKPRSASVEALEDSELIELPIADVNSYLSAQPIWLKTIFNTLLARLRNAIDIRE